MHFPTGRREQTGRISILSARNNRIILPHLREGYHPTSYIGTNRIGHKVKFPETSECSTVACRRFYERHGFPGIIDSIGRTHIPLKNVGWSVAGREVLQWCQLFFAERFILFRCSFSPSRSRLSVGARV